MSPEQARGEVENLDARSDIFSLGALLRFLLTGLASGTPGHDKKLSDKSLNAICLKASAQAPAERYPNVSELSLDVSRFLDGLAVEAHHETAYLLMRLSILLFLHR